MTAPLPLSGIRIIEPSSATTSAIAPTVNSPIDSSGTFSVALNGGELSRMKSWEDATNRTAVGA